MFGQTKLTKGQLTKIKLLEATARCVSKIGIEKTSFTEIAKEADVKRPLVAYHFPRKNDVFYRVILYITEKLTKIVLAHREGIRGRAGIIKTITEYIDFFQEHSHYFHCFFHLFYLASIEERYRLLNTKIANRVLTRLKFDIESMFLEECGGIHTSLVESFAEELYTSFVGNMILFNSSNIQNSPELFRAKIFANLKIQMDLIVEYQKKRLSAQYQPV